jgi:hypothetical protein
MDHDKIVAELYRELNFQLHSQSPTSRPISEEAVRFILQNLENLGYQVIPKHVEVDISRTQDLVTAITNVMPDVKWDELSAAVPAILQDLASRGWILIPPV